MNDELEKLWPKVRDALAEVQGEADCRCSEPYKSRGMKDPQCNHDLQDSVDVIRAELLRLADECRTLKDQSIYPRAQLLANFAAANERAEKAEAEIAALKTRIFHGIVLDVDDLARGHAGLPSEWRGKRVRLVVEE